jgi:hypothetical protein
MHSLSVRRTSGSYSAEELKRSEALDIHDNRDCIFVMKDGSITTVEEMKKQLWIRDEKDDCYISDYDVEFKESPMQVLGDFRGRLHYALASVYGRQTKGWEGRLREITNVLDQYLPNVEFHLRELRRDVGVNTYCLFQFLKKNNISMEEFLLNNKYIVVVNLAEYQKMRFLGMVNETNIENTYDITEETSVQMNIENGIWKIGQGDLRFGRSPYRVLGTVEGKARYALATYESANIDEVLEILQEVYPELKSIELPPCWYSKEARDRGYCEDSALPLDVPLRDFILDKKYVIISDGDEYCIWNQFKKTKLFNLEEYPDEEILEHDFY